MGDATAADQRRDVESPAERARGAAFPCIYDTEKINGPARSIDRMTPIRSAAAMRRPWRHLLVYAALARALRRGQADSALGRGHARFSSSSNCRRSDSPYFRPDLSPAAELREQHDRPERRRAGKTARLTGDPALRGSPGGRSVYGSARPPGARLYDFETFYSCGPNLSTDRSGLRHPPANNLSIQWAAIGLELLPDRQSDWLRAAVRARPALVVPAGLVSAPLRKVYLFGGFGVMNTDGSGTTGGRRVSCRPTRSITKPPATSSTSAAPSRPARFALMDIPENHDNASTIASGRAPIGRASRARDMLPKAATTAPRRRGPLDRLQLGPGEDLPPVRTWSAILSGVDRQAPGRPCPSTALPRGSSRGKTITSP